MFGYTPLTNEDHPWLASCFAATRDDKMSGIRILETLISHKREVGRLYRASIRSSRISLSPTGVREIATGI